MAQNATPPRGSFHGEVVGLFIASQEGGSTRGQDGVKAVSGQGLEGDRYFTVREAGADPSKQSEITLIEALRTLRLIHYSAWIARRWEDPAFPAAFPWFGTQRYWQDRILELREQIAAMEEEPLRVP